MTRLPIRGRGVHGELAELPHNQKEREKRRPTFDAVYAIQPEDLCFLPFCRVRDGIRREIISGAIKDVGVARRKSERCDGPNMANALPQLSHESPEGPRFIPRHEIACVQRAVGMLLVHSCRRDPGSL